MLERGHSGDGCDLVSTLCKYYLFRVGQGATIEVWKYLFRAANVWWRCVHYFVICLTWFNLTSDK